MEGLFGDAQECHLHPEKEYDMDSVIIKCLLKPLSFLRLVLGPRKGSYWPLFVWNCWTLLQAPKMLGKSRTDLSILHRLFFLYRSYLAWSTRLIFSFINYKWQRIRKICKWMRMDSYTRPRLIWRTKTDLLSFDKKKLERNSSQLEPRKNWQKFQKKKRFLDPKSWFIETNIRSLIMWIFWEENKRTKWLFLRAQISLYLSSEFMEKKTFQIIRKICLIFSN